MVKKYRGGGNIWRTCQLVLQTRNIAVAEQRAHFGKEDDGVGSGVAERRVRNKSCTTLTGFNCPT